MTFNHRANVTIHHQPTETSCGPTCLKAIYDYYGHEKDLTEIISEIPNLELGGTLAVQLGIHALTQGFDVTIFTYNIMVFDPTWFYPRRLTSDKMIEKLKSQIKAKDKKKLQFACNGYIKFLEMGGIIRMRDLSHQLIRRYLKKGIPLLTGLSSTYLYRSCREYSEGDKQIKDDIKGFAEGHFVILEHYKPETGRVNIVDPYLANPYSKDLHYEMPLRRLINAIMLGVLTYDANFMVIHPKSSEEEDLTELTQINDTALD